MHALNRTSQRFMQMQQLRDGGDDSLTFARKAVSEGLSSPGEEKLGDSIAPLLESLSQFEFAKLPPPIRTVGAIARYPTRNFLFAALLLRVTDPLVNQQTINLFKVSSQEFPNVADVKNSFGSSQLTQVMHLFGPGSTCQLYEIHEVRGHDVIKPTADLKEECSHSFSPITVLREQCLSGIVEIYENSTLHPPLWLGIEKMTRYLEHFHYSYWRAVTNLSSEKESKLKDSLYNSIKKLLQDQQVITQTSLLSEDYNQAFEFVRQRSKIPYPQSYRDLSYIFSVEIVPGISTNLSESLFSESSILDRMPLPAKIEITFKEIVEKIVHSERARGRRYSLREEEALFEEQIRLHY